MIYKMTVAQAGLRAEGFAFFPSLLFVHRQLDFQLSNQYSGWAFPSLVLQHIGLIQRGDSQLGLDNGKEGGYFAWSIGQETYSFASSCQFFRPRRCSLQ